MYATNQYNSLIYPFFIIGFKGVGGNVWVATNQCLGGAATCVNIAERLNAQLQQCDSEEVQPVNSAAFSIAMNGSEARLYISWKHDERNYYMADADCYYLRRADDYIRFRKTARNIVDWGKNDRLHSIRKSLDALIEEARKQTSREAKSRPREEEEEEEDNSKGKRARA
ncbi:hypothetical protein SCUCBS95973_001639 [Sporothrix curviconia]|uniref:DUF7924 domain-containing protein n=1 Tax=Sporothrix curviconia TaxID=1260050 RepID=A0ABP0B0A1_9PEZI